MSRNLPIGVVNRINENLSSGSDDVWLLGADGMPIRPVVIDADGNIVGGPLRVNAGDSFQFPDGRVMFYVSMWIDGMRVLASASSGGSGA